MQDLLLTTFVLEPDLRFLGLVPVLFVGGCARIDQPALQSDVSSCLGSFLPRTRSRLLLGIRDGREMVRHDNGEEDPSSIR